MATDTYGAGTMPTTYDNDVNQATEQGMVDIGWMKSLGGLLKAAQIVTALIVIICASVWPFFAWNYGGGWVQFVSISSFVLLAIMYVLYIFRLPSKISTEGAPWNFIVVSVVCIICSSVWSPFGKDYGGGWVQFVCITATIMVSVRYLLYIFRLPDKMSPRMPFYFVEFVFYAVFTLFYFISAAVSSAFGNRDASIGASAFFTWLATVLFAVDVYFAFSNWRVSGEGPNFARSRLGGGSSDTTGITPGGGTSMPADPYVASPPASAQPTVSSVEKGPPPQY